MRDERAARDRVRAEAPPLVLRLPVRLEQKVAREVGDHEDRKHFDPVHRADPND